MCQLVAVEVLVLIGLRNEEAGEGDCAAVPLEESAGNIGSDTI